MILNQIVPSSFESIEPLKKEEGSEPKLKNKTK